MKVWRALWTVVSFEWQRLRCPALWLRQGKEVGASHVLVYGPRAAAQLLGVCSTPRPHSAHSQHTHAHTFGIWVTGPSAGSLASPRLGLICLGLKQTGWELGGGLGKVLDPSRRRWSEASSSWGRDQPPRPQGWGGGGDGLL